MNKLYVLTLILSTTVVSEGLAQVPAENRKRTDSVRRAQEEFQFRNDWANLKRFETENQSLMKMPQSGDRVVFMGNSITQGWSDQDPGFFKDKAYVNRGIGGQTTPQMLLRFRNDVINLKPAVVVILAGTNDIAGNTGVTSDETIAGNIQSMALLAKHYKIRVVLSSILPVFDYPWKKGLHPVPRIAAINKALKEFAAANQMIYLDYFTPMADEKKGLKAELTYDGVHPNLSGYKVMEPLAEAAIKAALKLRK